MFAQTTYMDTYVWQFAEDTDGLRTPDSPWPRGPLVVLLLSSPRTSVCCTAFLLPTSSPIQNNSGVQMLCTSKKKEGREERKGPINFTQFVLRDAEAAAQMAPRERKREHEAAEVNWQEKVPLMMLACSGCPASRRHRVSAPN